MKSPLSSLLSSSPLFKSVMSGVPQTLVVVVPISLVLDNRYV